MPYDNSQARAKDGKWTSGGSSNSSGGSLPPSAYAAGMAKAPSGRGKGKVQLSSEERRAAVSGGKKDLRDANLVEAGMSNGKFANADMRDANMEYADMRTSDFSGADLRGATARDANFGGSDFRGADLRGTDFRGANLGVCDFRGAKLEGARFEGADIFNIRTDAGVGKLPSL